MSTSLTKRVCTCGSGTSIDQQVFLTCNFQNWYFGPIRGTKYKLPHPINTQKAKYG